MCLGRVGHRIYAPGAYGLISAFLYLSLSVLFLFLISFFLIPERGREGGGQREREEHQCERNTDWLPSVYAPTGD